MKGPELSLLQPLLHGWAEIKVTMCSVPQAEEQEPEGKHQWEGQVVGLGGERGSGWGSEAVGG